VAGERLQDGVSSQVVAKRCGLKRHRGKRDRQGGSGGDGDGDDGNDDQRCIIL
jgi:hypothetical protein